MAQVSVIERYLRIIITLITCRNSSTYFLPPSKKNETQYHINTKIQRSLIATTIRNNSSSFISKADTMTAANAAGTEGVFFRYCDPWSHTFLTIIIPNPKPHDAPRPAPNQWTKNSTPANSTSWAMKPSVV